MIGYWDGIRENCKGWECVTIGEKMHEICSRFSDRTALYDDESFVTYAELDAKVSALSNGLYSQGLRKGDVVLLQIPNCIDFAAIFLSLQNIGCITVMLLPASREADVRSISEKAGAKAYFYEPDPLNKSFAERAEIIAAEGKMAFYNKESIKKAADLPYDPCYEKREKPVYSDIALLLLSGGTTGTPKLIPRTHGDYLYCAKITSERCGWHDGIISLGLLPSAHNFALGTPGILGTMLYGGTTVLTEYAFPNEILTIIEEKHVQAAAFVPMILGRTADFYSIMNDIDTSSLEYILVGGSVFTDTEAKRIDSLFSCSLIQVYGMGEGLLCTTEPDMPFEDIINTQGRPSSEYDMVKIVDENMNEVPDGEAGQLITRGPYTITGYYRLKTDSFFNGWYCTGDRAVITRSGNIKITGRIKEMINRAGEKIIPSHVEEVLLTHPNIKACAVLGKPDTVLGNKIAAYIVTDGTELHISDIRSYFTKCGIASYRCPDEVNNVSDLPLTAVGKVDKKALLAQINTDGSEMKNGV